MNFFNRLINSFSTTQPGFIFMWVLIFIAIFALILIIRKAIYLKSCSNLNSPLFINRIKSFVLDKNIDSAIKLCNSAGKRALPWIVSGALDASREHPQKVVRTIEQRTVSIIPRLEKNLGFLSMLGNISTLIGLMGTIYGLILSFAAVGSPDIDPAIKSSMLADGISAAMNTTLLGLVISIPCILFYTSFRTKADSIISDIDRYVVTIIKMLAPFEKVNKSYKPSQRKTKEAVETEADMVPIMGLMVCLIPLLLSSAEFVKLGNISINLPQAGGATSSSQEDQKPKVPPKELNLGLVITEKGINIIHSLIDKNKSEKDDEPDVPVKKDGSQDYELLNSKLFELKKDLIGKMINAQSSSFYNTYKKFLRIKRGREFYHYKDHENVKLMADKKINYQAIVSIMDASRLYKNKNGQKYLLFPSVSIGVMR